MRKTKIICTLGPSTDKGDVLRDLIANGMNVARFNFSHGSYEEHGGRLAKLKALREELGLHGGYFERFFNYVVRLLRGDMGICYSTRQNVATRIAQTFPNTVKLASFAVAFAVVFGLTFGIVSAIRQYSIIDNIVMSISMIGISMPSFWCGLLLMLLFCVKLKWLPA